MSKILLAARIAAEAHEGQLRKYTGTPYVYHPARVAGRVALRSDATEDMVAAAFLHDVLEDTAMPPSLLVEKVGLYATNLVQELTNPSKGSKAPRTDRKAQDLEHLKKASQPAKIIKLLDRIDNLTESDRADPFTHLYARESLVLAGAIGSADPSLQMELVNLARSIITP